MFKRVKIIILCFVFLILGIAGGYYWGFSIEQKALDKALNAIHPIRDHSSSYKFISPLLAYIIPSAQQEKTLVTLKSTITDVIASEKKIGGLADASVFFYDMNRGRWIGVNEKQKYNPASMLKVVTMIAYFKKAEMKPSTLSKKLTYTKEMDALLKTGSFYALSELHINTRYTVESLIEKVITKSDNGAQILLSNSIDKKELDTVYSALNIENPDGAQSGFSISPRTYSLFFRIIYSATYLDRELSEKALGILSRTTFDDGIVAGLPTNLVVSHKFGEYLAGSNDSVQDVELHDCGIVYYPVNPYFLCVMTKGNNLDELKKVIKNISSLVYQNYGNYK